MKVNEHKDRRSGARTLTVMPQKREQLEYAQAEWLRYASRAERFLLPFDYDANAADLRLNYDVTGCARLANHLRARLTSSQYASALTSVYDALVLCTAKGYPASSMLFDASHVYVGESGTLELAYVPLSGVAESESDSPRALLGYLASRRNVSFVVAEDGRHRASLDDFVRRTPVLQVSALRDFLEGEFGLSLGGGSGSLGVARPRPAMGAAGPVGAASSGAPVGAAGLDMVAMLSHRASASEVAASQSVAARAADAVAGVSPTSAERVLSRPAEAGAASAGEPEPPVEPQSPAGPAASEAVAAPEAVAPAPPQPSAEPLPLTTPAASARAPEPSRPAAAPEPPAAPAVPATPPTPEAPEPPRAQTVFFGRGVGSLAAGFSPQASRGGASASRPLFLERIRDGLRLPLDLAQPKTVGRSERSDLALGGNQNLSRVHARLSWEDGHVIVQDLSSLNGITVRGGRLEPGGEATVEPGERFLLADEALRVVTGDMR